MNPNRFRCPACRTRRTSFVKLIEHCRDKKHKVCNCGGYHYAHRPGSPTCVENPMGAVHLARRDTDVTEDELLEIAAHCAWENPGRPFTNWSTHTMTLNRICDLCILAVWAVISTCINWMFEGVAFDD